MWCGKEADKVRKSLESFSHKTQVPATKINKPIKERRED